MTEPVPLPVARNAEPTWDVAIVGAGLCALALARTLHARGLTVQLLEARERLGGRALTLQCPDTGQALDLGPTWFWPETEPRVAALVAALNLPDMAQHDPGDALWLTDPNRAPEPRHEPDGVHAGARRIQGGVAALVQALAAALPQDSIQLGKTVRAVRDCGNRVELVMAQGPPLRARHVVLALPPRLALQHLEFLPALPEHVTQAMQDTPTWMAAQAKALSTFAQAFWRSNGQSGNAFVRHPQAVLDPVYDCCAHAGEAPQPGALGGFVALDAAQRENFQRGLPLLLESQLAQLFGVEAQQGRLFVQDWALEPWTCSALDLAQPSEPPQADPLLRQPLWGGRLYMGGSETAAHGAGHMEGALESADRIAHALLRGQIVSAHSSEHGERLTRAAAIGAYSCGVVTLRSLAAERYRQHLTRLLVAQQTDMLTQRALVATVEQCYSEALSRLDPLLESLDASQAEVVQGRHALTASLLAPFEGWNKELLDRALAFNGASCALSNFAQEHRPDAETVRAITRDMASAWREFAIELNSRLLLAAEAQLPA
jgi:monoamine oxidase